MENLKNTVKENTGVKLPTLEKAMKKEIDYVVVEDLNMKDRYGYLDLHTTTTFERAHIDDVTIVNSIHRGDVVYEDSTIDNLQYHNMTFESFALGHAYANDDMKPSHADRLTIEWSKGRDIRVGKESNIGYLKIHDSHIGDIEMHGGQIHNLSIMDSTVGRISNKNGHIDIVGVSRSTVHTINLVYGYTFNPHVSIEDSHVKTLKMCEAFVRGRNPLEIKNSKIDELDLRNAWIPGADFYGTDFLKNSKFRGAYLYGATMPNYSRQQLHGKEYVEFDNGMRFMPELTPQGYGLWLVPTPFGWYVYDFTADWDSDARKKNPLGRWTPLAMTRREEGHLCGRYKGWYRAALIDFDRYVEECGPDVLRQFNHHYKDLPIDVETVLKIEKAVNA